MDFRGKTALVTGGASGIGLELSRRFVSSGAKVVICGRRKDALDEAKALVPELATIQCDLSEEGSRVAFADRVGREYPELAVLVNNAGIQNRPAPLTQPQDWSSHKRELATNLEAPLHLTMLLLPLLLKHPGGAVINVTSGLAFVPIATMPTYCLTKAAMHSFLQSLRWQLRDTPIRVIEMAPPAVQTDLGGKGLHDFGVPLEEYVNFAFERILAGDEEFGYKFSAIGMNASAEERRVLFDRMNDG